MANLRQYDPTTPGGSDRFNCPICGMPMYYTFPRDVEDKDLDAVLWRLQECRNERCRENPSVDVVNGKTFIIPTTPSKLGAFAVPEIIVDGIRYNTVRGYFVDIGQIQPGPKD